MCPHRPPGITALARRRNDASNDSCSTGSSGVMGAMLVILGLDRDGNTEESAHRTARGDALSRRPERGSQGDDGRLLLPTRRQRPLQHLQLDSLICSPGQKGEAKSPATVTRNVLRIVECNFLRRIALRSAAPTVQTPSAPASRRGSAGRAVPEWQPAVARWSIETRTHD
jgi:hypothetical protein